MTYNFSLLPVKNLWKLIFFQNIFEILSFWKISNTPKMYSTQKFLFIESLLQVFASVCPPQPDGESLFMQIIHNISIECFSKKIHYKSPNSQKCLRLKMVLIGLRDLFWFILSNFIWGSQHFHKSSVSHHPNAPSETYPERGSFTRTLIWP